MVENKKGYHWLLFSVLHIIVGILLFFGVISNLNFGAWHNGPFPNPYVASFFQLSCYAWWFPASLIIVHVPKAHLHIDIFFLSLVLCLSQAILMGYFWSKLWDKFKSKQDIN